MSDPPLNLAGVGVSSVNVDDSLIDPALAASANDFFATAAEQNDKFDDELTAAAVAAATAAAHHHHQQQQQQQHAEGTLGASLVHGLNVGGVGMGPVGGVGAHGHVATQQTSSGAAMQALATEASVATGGANVTSDAMHVHPDHMDDDMPTSLDPSISAAHLAPFSRPQRGDGTPHPEVIAFANRAEFEVWFEGESSWCHFVQRRTTTPEKRAEERLRARIKAHENMLSTMSVEEQATAPPLKRRRRNRTSNIREKVTFTCHHAGRYDPKHSTTLPREKLRLNTKKSVKCDCPARIVLTEMDEGDCKVSYYWRHEGHDAYADDELESGRLPKVIDEWLVAQISAGKDTDEIRRSLMMTDDEKADYLQGIAEDPSRIDPNKPPPLALTLRIKYPDIYNRFRKLRGPIKEFKPPKNPRGGRKRAALEVKPEDNGEGLGLPLEQDMAGVYPPMDNGVNIGVNVNVNVNVPMNMQPSMPVGVNIPVGVNVNPHDHHHQQMDTFLGDMDNMDTSNMPAEFLSEMGTQEGLARVLLALPQHREGEQVDDAALSDVLRMAREDIKDREWAGVDLQGV